MEPAKKMDNQENLKADEASEPEHEISVERGSAEPRRRRRRTSASDVSVNMDELRELIQLVRENDFSEFELERESFRVRLRRGLSAGASEPSPAEDRPASSTSQTAPSTSAAAGEAKATVPVHPGARAETAASEDQGLHIIPSPIVGTFYRSASPNAEPFVKIGSAVEPESVVCIIEAMKLMNEIQAETSGEVAKIYVENGQPVEYGQPLFGIKK
ncbi:MAG TPA: acetyl-CoA carboxylase biotin carboxyl carrier protein [Pyrinomonadaceae bacterium]|nr:acetyl-CoA carboxylase biotin carboxyl carrier protein [Pyrinomonadaceae bacterium]